MKTKEDIPQRDRFIETARALGADEDEAAFKEKLAVIARHKPMPLDVDIQSGGECDDKK